MRNKTKFLLLSMAMLLSLGGCSGTYAGNDKSGVYVPEKQESTEIPEKVGNMNTEEIIDLIGKAQKLVHDNGAKLWGSELNSRMIVFDSETNKFIASENSVEGEWEKIGNMYTGVLPEDVAIGNSTLQLGGKSWATVEYSGFADENQALEVCVHEMFHNNQEALGHMAVSDMQTDEDSGYDNSHMDEMDARILQKMEWEALNKALYCEGEEKKETLKAALTFRKVRQKEYDSKKDESCFEIEEGLADYTAKKILYNSDEKILQEVEKEWKKILDEAKVESLVRSFGYYSGFLYGVLLDESGEEWKSSIQAGSDLGDELQRVYHISDISENIEDIKYAYGYEEIYQYEQKRNEEKQKKEKQLMEQYVEGTTLTLPLGEMEMEMNPNKVTPLADCGTLYQQAAFYDEWGVIRSEETGILWSADYEWLIVPAGNIEVSGNTITGDGWSLTLNEGYSVEKDEEGNYQLISNIN